MELLIPGGRGLLRRRRRRGGGGEGARARALGARGARGAAAPGRARAGRDARRDAAALHGPQLPGRQLARGSGRGHGALGLGGRTPCQRRGDRRRRVCRRSTHSHAHVRQPAGDARVRGRRALGPRRSRAARHRRRRRRGRGLRRRPLAAHARAAPARGHAPPRRAPAARLVGRRGGGARAAAARGRAPRDGQRVHRPCGEPRCVGPPGARLFRRVLPGMHAAGRRQRAAANRAAGGRFAGRVLAGCQRRTLARIMRGGAAGRLGHFSGPVR